jgi:putative ABC transport system ATP-binding protein
LVHEPRLVVCDEPTAALDHASGQAVMELLAGSAVRPDRAVIVVTHDTRVFHYAHSIARMDDGRIVDVRRPENPRAWDREHTERIPEEALS